MSFFKSFSRFFSSLFQSRDTTPLPDLGDAGDIPKDTVFTDVDPATLDAHLENASDDEAWLNSLGVGGNSGNTGNAGNDDAEEDTPVEIEPRPVHNARFMWCIDNGHGKATLGKRSPVFGDGTQFREYEFTRDINRRVMARLDELGVKYFNVTPEVEGDVKLSERCRRANELSSTLPKLFLSIHSNAFGRELVWSAPKGLETWFHGNSKTGKALASAFQRHLMTAMPWSDRGIKFHEDPKKVFYVLRKTSMPAVLTECGFYTNKAECTQLIDPQRRQAIAEAHVQAIMEIEKNGTGSIPTYPKVVKIPKS